jgi:hypothetical protein
MEIVELKEKFANDESFRNELFAGSEPVVLQALQSKGYVVRSQDQEKEFLTNYEKNQLEPKINQLFEQKIGERIRQVHDQYDKDLLEMTGQRKDVNEKTYDFLKRTYSSRLDETSRVLQSQVGQLTDKLTVREQELEQTKQEYQKQFSSFKVNSTIDSELSKRTIYVPPTITDEETKARFISEQKEMMKSRLLSKYSYSDTDNGILFLKPDGTPVLNPKNASKATMTDLLDTEFGVYFIDSSKQGGLGSGGNGINPAVVGTKDYELASIKTIEDRLIKTQKFDDYASKNNLVRGSQAWQQSYKTVFS